MFVAYDLYPELALRTGALHTGSSVEKLMSHINKAVYPRLDRVVALSTELTLEKKISGFLQLSLNAYHVPSEEVQQTIAFVSSMDIRGISENVMHKLLQALMMKYRFTLGKL